MAEILRPATLADRPAICVLLGEVGFPGRSEAGWRWLFEENPTHQRLRPEVGWVLEDAAGIQGYLGNLLLDYQLDGRPVLGATCTSWVVRPSARGESLRLLTTFFKQRDPEIFLTTTANGESEAAYRGYKAEVAEGGSFQRGTIWVARDDVALVAKGLPSVLAPVSRLARLLSGRARVPRSREADAVRRLRPDQIDGRFDRLWAEVGARPGLRRARDAGSLRWSMSDPDQGPGVAVLALDRGPQLAGYALVAPHRPSRSSDLQLRLVDLCVAAGHADAAGPLLRRVVEHGCELGAGLVYAPPCGEELAGLLAGRGGEPLARGHVSHFVRARRRADTAGMVAPGRWAATGLDGDIPLVLRALA